HADEQTEKNQSANQCPENRTARFHLSPFEAYIALDAHSVVTALAGDQMPAFFGRPWGIRGMERRRTPIASNIAFATAGPIPVKGVSPAPTGGWSLRSGSTTSISGRSLKRGTRY